MRERRPHPKALSPAERETVVAKLNGERCRDLAPAEVYATLLKLRALISNRDFDAYFAWHLTREHQRVHQSRYQGKVNLAA